MADGGKDGSVINVMNAETAKPFRDNDDDADKSKQLHNKKDETLRKSFDNAFRSNKAYNITKYTEMKKPPGNYDGHAFGVVHYAALVTYSIDDWWDRNRSDLPKLVHAVITTSEWRTQAPYMMSNFERDRDPEASGGPATVGSQFRLALKSLVDDTLEPCTCQFVRCIKPNKLKVSRATAQGGSENAWQSALVLNQLRYTGMLDTLMIRKQGFPARPDHQTFWKKFWMMNPTIREPKALFDHIAANEQPPAENPDLFNTNPGRTCHFYFGNNSSGTSRVLMKDATFRYLEAQVSIKRQAFVTVLRSIVQSAHLCADYNIAKGAAKILFPEAVKFVQQDTAAQQAEAPKMEVQHESMKRYMVENVQILMAEKQERATMLAEEKYMDQYMLQTAAERFQKDKDRHLESAEEWIAKCRQYKEDFENLLAMAEPEPMVKDLVPDEDNNQPKFVHVKVNQNRPPRRAGSTRTRYKLNPVQTMSH
jgi:hypothetical protein